MGKTPNKKHQSSKIVANKQNQQPITNNPQEMLQIYTKMGDLSKDELIYLRQQLQEKQALNQQIHSGSSKQRNKSQQPNSTARKPQDQTSNKLFVFGQCQSNEKMGQIGNNKDYFNQMESVNVYLQHLGATNKRKKGKNKPYRRNLDLVEVCNDTTINTQKQPRNNSIVISDPTLPDDFQLNSSFQIMDKYDRSPIEGTRRSYDQQEIINIAIEEQEQEETTQKTLQDDDLNQIVVASSQNPIQVVNSKNGNIMLANPNPPLFKNSQQNMQLQQSSFNMYLSNQRKNSKQSAPASLRKSLKMPVSSQITGQIFTGQYKPVLGIDKDYDIVINSSEMQQKRNSQGQNNLYIQSQSPREILKCNQANGIGSALIEIKHQKLQNQNLTHSQKKDATKQLSKLAQTAYQNDQKFSLFNKDDDSSIQKQNNEIDDSYVINRPYQTIDQYDANKKDSLLPKKDEECDNTQFLLDYVPINPTGPTLESYSPIKSEGKLTIDHQDIQINNEQLHQDITPTSVSNNQNTYRNKENFQLHPIINNNSNAMGSFNHQQQIVQQKILIKAKAQNKEQQPIQKRIKVDAIQAQCISIEPHFKRAMNKLGWQDIGPTSAQFHIRFDITDKESNTQKMKSSQWYTHFPCNRELVTKAGLCKNLWIQQNQDYELKVKDFFPRCYDLSDQKQVDLFIQDFQQTAILNVIKAYSEYFLQNTKGIYQFVQEYKEKHSLYQNNKRIFKQKFKFKCSQYDQLTSGVGNMLGNDSLRMAVQYSKIQIIRKQDVEMNKRFQRKFTEEDIQSMIEYSQLIIEQGGIKVQKFPLHEQIKTILMHEHLGRVVPQYNTIDGRQNVWVVKPSYNARGLGVYCANQIKDIIQQGKKCQSKIVQKYIEKPFLLNNKKFDIRQWVLVTSWEPLDIYVFEGAYLKICGNSFDLNNLSDQFSHLSNFTIQKTNKQFTNDDLVMSNEQFEKYVQSQNQKPNFNWSKDLYPLIQDVVLRTFKGVQESLEQRPNTFEIYGFDLILDEDLKPWVIEVNLSPACNERTDWLTKMLDDMSYDLLYFVENKIIQQNENEWESNYKERIKKGSNNQGLYLNEEYFYTENEIKYKWIKIEECIQEAKNYQVALQLMNQNAYNKVGQLEILGQKCDLKYEKRIDKQYQKSQASIKIQQNYRGYKGRKIFLSLQQEKASLFIQRFLRSEIAKNRVKRIIQFKSSVLIQRYIRKQLAYKQVKQIIAQKIAAAKEFVALKIQSHFRRKQSRKQFLLLRNNAKAKLIQTYLRKMRAKQIIQERLSHKAKIVLIQRTYKRRFKDKNRKAQFIQKYLKAIQARQKVIKLLQISNGTQKLSALLKWKKEQKAFSTLIKHSKCISIQAYLRRILAKNFVQKLRVDKAQAQILMITAKLLTINLKKVALEFNNEKQAKSIIIQRQIKGHLARIKVKRMQLIKFKNDKATYIQRYLRRFLAKNLVEFKQYFLFSVIKIQSFLRMKIAIKFLNKLKQQKKLLDHKKKKDLEKKFNKNQKVEKDIENYIESLFQKESQQSRTIGKLQNCVTPLSARRKNTNGSNSNLLRQSMTSQNQVRPEGVVSNLAHQFAQQPIQQTNSEKKSTSYKASGPSSQDFDQEAILAASMIDDQDNQNETTHQIQDRQQKALRIRKQQKASQGLMQNLVQNKGNSQNYQQQLNSKIQQAASKVKSQRTQQLGNHPSKSKLLQVTKPKTFAENLMNMLALQNIGQVFSENPVEALHVFKEGQTTQDFSQSKQVSSNTTTAVQRRNSAVVARSGTHDQSFINKSEKQTIENKVQFPKLNEFKSATNNIYLQNRPVVDPRNEAEQQQIMVLEQKFKQQYQQQQQTFIQPQTYSKGHLDIQTSVLANNGGRKSSESLLAKYQNPTPSSGVLAMNEYFNQQSHIEEHLLMQRPGASSNTHTMVIQAYKKQTTAFQPFDHFKKPQNAGQQKKRGDSINTYLNKNIPQKKTSNGMNDSKMVMNSENHNHHRMVGGSANKQEMMPPINEAGGTKLIII